MLLRDVGFVVVLPLFAPVRPHLHGTVSPGGMLVAVHPLYGRGLFNMSGGAARHRPMAHELRLWVAVTVEAEAVEPCFYPDFDVRAGAAVAVDAGVESAAIGVVVVAGQAVDAHMLGVIKGQG